MLFGKTDYVHMTVMIDRSKCKKHDFKYTESAL